MSAWLPTARAPEPPQVDVADAASGAVADADGRHGPPHHARVEAAARAWITHGSRRPPTARLVQLARLGLYLLGGVLVVSVTDGLGSLLHLSSWWDETIVFQKIVVWTLVWQLLGLGRGLAPRGVGALPPVAGLSYWLTPGTMRLPAFPDRVPFTAGTRRAPVDVVLYAAVLAIAAGLLGLTGAAGGRLPPAGIVALLTALGLLALRDRTPLFAARPEVTVLLLVVFLLPAGDVVYAAKVAVVAVWWVTAIVRVNRHFAFAVATTVADAPWLRRADLRRRLWQRDGHDLVPADAVRWTAHTLLVLAFVLPVVLLCAGGGVVTAAAVVLAVAVQVAVASAMSREGQLELSAFGVLTTVLLFGHNASVGPASMTSASRTGLLVVAFVVVVTAAAFAPERTAVLSATRHAAGSGPLSVWLFATGSAARFDVALTADGGTAELLHYRDLGMHALHPNGRALDGLLGRAVDDPDAYRVRSAEFVAGAALGWGIGSGFDHDRRLLAAIQERCGFGPGELRVVTLDAHAMGRTELRYRILDAATGLVEVGLVDPDDMVDRIPWHVPAKPRIPVEVQFSVDGCTGYVSPSEFDFLADRAAPADRESPAVRAAVRTSRPAPSRSNGPPSRVAPPPTRPRPDRPRPAPRVPAPQPAFVVVPPPVDAATPGRHAAPGEARPTPHPVPRSPRHARS